MSSSESETDTSDISSEFHELRGKLYEIDLHLKKSIKALEIFNKNFTALDEALSKTIPIPKEFLETWKKENRLNTNGSKVLLTTHEATLLHLEEGWNSVYQVIKSLNNYHKKL